MNYQEANRKERWFRFYLYQQMANIGMDVCRAIEWQLSDATMSRLSFERALGLLDFTLEDPKNKKHLKELCKLREFLVDYFINNNNYRSSGGQWNDYFYIFAYVSAINREHSNS